MKLSSIYFDNEDDLMDLTGLTREEIQEQGVDLDDWDYGFFCSQFRAGDSEIIESWLHGCCGNQVYAIRNKEGDALLIGMAYHS